MVSRVVITALCVGIAVVLPGFGRVMAFLGSFSAFLICIILPVRLHLLHHPFSLRNSKLTSILKSSYSTSACPPLSFRLVPYRPIHPYPPPTAHSQPMSKWTSDRFTNTMHWVLVIASTALMIAGTVWAFLPGSGHDELET